MRREVNGGGRSRARRFAQTALAGCAFAFVVVACGSDDSGGGTSKSDCSPNDTRACVGPGACQGGKRAARTESGARAIAGVGRGAWEAAAALREVAVRAGGPAAAAGSMAVPERAVALRAAPAMRARVERAERSGSMTDAQRRHRSSTARRAAVDRARRAHKRRVRATTFWIRSIRSSLTSSGRHQNPE